MDSIPDSGQGGQGRLLSADELVYAEEIARNRAEDGMVVTARVIDNLLADIAARTELLRQCTAALAEMLVDDNGYCVSCGRQEYAGGLTHTEWCRGNNALAALAAAGFSGQEAGDAH